MIQLLVLQDLPYLLERIKHGLVHLGYPLFQMQIVLLFIVIIQRFKEEVHFALGEADTLSEAGFVEVILAQRSLLNSISHRQKPIKCLIGPVLPLVKPFMNLLVHLRLFRGPRASRKHRELHILRRVVNFERLLKLVVRNAVLLRLGNVQIGEVDLVLRYFAFHVLFEHLDVGKPQHLLFASLVK